MEKWRYSLELRTRRRSVFNVTFQLLHAQDISMRATYSVHFVLLVVISPTIFDEACSSDKRSCFVFGKSRLQSSIRRSGRGISRFASAPQGKCLDNTAYWATAPSLQIFLNSYFTNQPTFRHYII
jgi:hypothetical protein